MIPYLPTCDRSGSYSLRERESENESLWEPINLRMAPFAFLHPYLSGYKESVTSYKTVIGTHKQNNRGMCRAKYQGILQSFAGLVTFGAVFGTGLTLSQAAGCTRTFCGILLEAPLT
jgi:hypothetical protein